MRSVQQSRQSKTFWSYLLLCMVSFIAITTFITFLVVPFVLCKFPHFSAAFFRRTLKEGRQYYCKGDSCDIQKIDKRYMCKFCRFRRCLSLGMNITSKFSKLLLILFLVVSSDYASTFCDSEMDGPIKKVLTAQKRTFIQRFEEALKLTDGDLVGICFYCLLAFRK